jgi:hypothetical protein
LQQSPGKFLPFKYYGNEQGLPENGLRELKTPA